MNQVRLTNVAVCRMLRHGKRFEVACYRNKILNYRQGTETDLSEVLQTDRVFTNVSKGLFAPMKDLELAFDNTNQEQCCRIILDKGQIQVSDMERSATLENTAREVANMVATKCVNPRSDRPYTINQIRDAMKKAEFSVQPTSARSVKQQFLDCVKAIQEKNVLDIIRAKMELAIVMPDTSVAGELVARLKKDALAIIQPSQFKERVQFQIDPSQYRAVDSIAKEIGATLEISRQIVTREGDIDVSLELERNIAQEQSQDAAKNVAAVEESNLSVEVDALDKELESMDVGTANPYLDDDNDSDFEERQQVSQRKKNKNAQKKSKKAKRREKEEASLRQERIDADKIRREDREFRLAHENKDKESGTTSQESNDGSKRSCNTCGGLFTPAEYRAHFRSDWHRYNQKLKMKGVSPIDEKEFLMFDADAFFADDL